MIPRVSKECKENLGITPQGIPKRGYGTQGQVVHGSYRHEGDQSQDPWSVSCWALILGLEDYS